MRFISASVSPAIVKSAKRRKPRDAQNPHRIFDKRLAHMPEHTRFEIGAAIERIDHGTGQFAVWSHFAGHRVDGQIAAREILFQRHVGCVEKLKAVISRRCLPLGARKRVFLVRLRMQKHGEILADRFKALRRHLLGGGADHDVIAVLNRQAEHVIADRTAHGVDVHRSFRAPSIHSATTGNAVTLAQ
jgi:hypothetical protein